MTMIRVFPRRQTASAALTLIVPMFALAACKPPPTDADMSREMPAPQSPSPSVALDSPPSDGAIWAPSSTPNRIIYGQPGEAPQMALACIRPAADLQTGSSRNSTLRITRIAAADEDAGALLALIGNGHIGRIAVDATEVSGRAIWQGELPAESTAWEPFAGPRQITATVPGAGMVTLNAGNVAWDFLVQCRGQFEAALPKPDDADPEQAGDLNP
ncbi:MAG: hypothetical protein ABJP48_08050 [Erythrobacter sp.]